MRPPTGNMSRDCEGKPDDGTPQTFQRTRHDLRAAPYRPLAARYRSHAGNRGRTEHRSADARDAPRIDPAESAARSRKSVERDRSASPYARTRLEKSGFYLADRPRLFRHDFAAGDSTQHFGEPGLVHGLYALSAGDQPGPARSAVQFPDHDLRSQWS